jgi:predicted flap endonuclease-1-like 5' DNA nuclease
MEFIIKIIPCLIVAALIGFFTGLFWLRRRRAEIWVGEKEKLETKVRGYERDLDKARGEARTLRDQMNPIKSELTATTGKLQSRDAEFRAIESKLKSLETLEPELSAKKAELSSLTAEVGSLRSKLAEAEKAARNAVEALSKRPAEPDKNLLAELSATKHQLAAKETEITSLLGRIKDLAPLGLQIKDRDLRLREWETKYSEAIQSKDNELNGLKARLGELEAAGAEANSRVTAFEARLRESESSHLSAIGAKDDEIATLTTRLRELESSALSKADHEAIVNELSTKHESSLNEKNTEIANLQARLGELDAANTKIAELEARLLSVNGSQTEELRSKESEISMLQLRIGELESLGVQNTERDTQHQAALAGKDEEINMLRARLGDLELVQSRLSSNEEELNKLKALVNDYGVKLRETEDRERAQTPDAETTNEIARLRSRINDLEVMHKRAVNPPPRGEWDDLEAINGVGPVLEKMLHRLGIYTFKQVAIWNDEHVDWVDSQLEHFHGRIRRENWIDSAKEEHFKKYGERI